MELPSYKITDAQEIEGFQAVVDSANAEAERNWDIAQANLAEEDRSAYVPLSVADYWLARVAEIVASYKRQLVEKWGAEVVRKIHAKELTNEQESMILDLGK